MSIIGTFRVGEDIAVALDIASGTAPEGLTVSAAMKRGRMPGGVFEPASNATAITCSVSPRAASGEIPAGWDLTVSAAVTADLQPGVYGIDAQFTGDGGAIDITDTTAVIRLTRSVVA